MLDSIASCLNIEEESTDSLMAQKIVQAHDTSNNMWYTKDIPGRGKVRRTYPEAKLL
jgi:hypothetical protein